MMIKNILFCVSLLYAGAIFAEEKSVEVEVPCYALDRNGNCSSWGGIIQGCKGPCEVSYSQGNENRFCSAQPGSNCNTSIATGTQIGTKKVKIPCLQNDESGACIRWGASNQGCKASPVTVCETNVTVGDRRATCKAEPGAECNSSIRLQLP